MKTKYLFPGLFMASLFLFNACLLAIPSVDPQKAIPFDLFQLNSDFKAPQYSPPTGPILIKGLVVSVHSGRRYPLVLALNPVGTQATESGTSGSGVILCLFENPLPGKEFNLGDEVTVAGVLDRISGADHLIMLYSVLVEP
jgi:hypothetical protein